MSGQMGKWSDNKHTSRGLTRAHAQTRMHLHAPTCTYMRARACAGAVRPAAPLATATPSPPSSSGAAAPADPASAEADAQAAEAAEAAQAMRVCIDAVARALEPLWQVLSAVMARIEEQLRGSAAAAAAGERGLRLGV